MKTYFALLIIFISTIAFGQKDDPKDYIEEGFVVLKDNTSDTIRGKVRERNSFVAAQLNTWLMHPDGSFVKYKTRDVRAVGIGQDLYYKKDKMPGGAPGALLKVGVRGKVTCYEMHSSMDVTYYLQKEGDKKARTITTAPKRNTFKDQKKLAKYFTDDQEIYQKVKSKEYDCSMTPRIVREYNERHPTSGNGIN